VTPDTESRGLHHACRADARESPRSCTDRLALALYNVGKVREMAIPCAHCGREYDVTLFEFGRTLWCTCGNRVGLEPRIRPAANEAERRFSADAMLGKLARWLRLLGVDCSYESDIADAELVRRAIEQGRTILTRDRALPEEWWMPDIHVVQAERTFEQLREVVRFFDLGSAVRPFTRCSECNQPLVRVAAAHSSRGVLQGGVLQGSVLDGRVPARILATHDSLRECPGCRRIYWQGSHTRRIQHVVEDLLAGD